MVFWVVYIVARYYCRRGFEASANHASVSCMRAGRRRAGRASLLPRLFFLRGSSSEEGTTSLLFTRQFADIDLSGADSGRGSLLQDDFKIHFEIVLHFDGPSGDRHRSNPKGGLL